MNKVRLFISYSINDRHLAGEIRRYIEKNEQFSCFLAHDDIESGSDWEKEIINNLSESECILPIQTENFKKSYWCQQEIGMAVQSGKVIVPLLPDESRDDPKGFHAKYQGFIIKTKDMEGSIAKLLESEIFRAMVDSSRRKATKAIEFEQLLIEPSTAKIKVKIDNEKTTFLRTIENHYLLLKDKNNWKDYWQAHLEAIHSANDIFVLADQIIRFKHHNAWEEFLKILIELHTINEDQDRYGRGGWINYLFYSIFLILGGFVQNYEYLEGLKKLLSLEKLNRDRLENILDWNIQASYIEAKNEADNPKFYTPRFKYTLDLVEEKEFPVKLKDFKNSVIDFDLVCFIYSIKFLFDYHGFKWYPCSMYYYGYRSPRFLLLIKQSSEFRESWAKTLLGMSGAEFLTFLENKVIPAYSNLTQRSPGFIIDSPFRLLIESKGK